MAVWKSWLTHTLWGGQWTFIHGSLVLSSPERQRKTSFTMSLQLIWSLICVYVSLKHKHNLSSSVFMFFCLAFPFQERKTEQIQSDGMKGSERIWWRRGELYSGNNAAAFWQTLYHLTHTHTQCRLWAIAQCKHFLTNGGRGKTLSRALPSLPLVQVMRLLQQEVGGWGGIACVRRSLRALVRHSSPSGNIKHTPFLSHLLQCKFSFKHQTYRTNI